MPLNTSLAKTKGRLELGVSRKDKQKRIRQEALRESLAAHGYHQHVSEDIEKLSNLNIKLDNVEIQRIRAANELRLRLIDKYLPSLKATEIEYTGETNLASLLVEAARVAKLLQEQQVKDVSEDKPAIEHDAV